MTRLHVIIPKSKQSSIPLTRFRFKNFVPVIVPNFSETSCKKKENLFKTGFFNPVLIGMLWSNRVNQFGNNSLLKGLALSCVHWNVKSVENGIAQIALLSGAAGTQWRPPPPQPRKPRDNSILRLPLSFLSFPRPPSPLSILTYTCVGSKSSPVFKG